jgi:hypothetical protein
MGAAQNLRQEALAFLDGTAPQVIAVKLDQIEGAKQGGVFVVPVAQDVPHIYDIGSSSFRLGKLSV